MGLKSNKMPNSILNNITQKQNSNDHKTTARNFFKEDSNKVYIDFMQENKFKMLVKFHSKFIIN